LLAGDVTLNVVHGNLILQGDELDNKVLITAAEEPGSYVVSGLDGTNLVQEGEPASTEFIVTGVHSVRARLGAGNDLIALVGANFRGDVAINAGADDDRVFVGTGGDAPELVGLLPADLSVGVRHSLTINAGNGNDQVSVDDVAIGRGLVIHAGFGNDTATLGSSAVADEPGARLRVQGGVHVGLGEGNDGLTMNQIRAQRAIVVQGGAGDNSVNANMTSSHTMAVRGGGGVDTVALTGLHVRHLGIHTGESDDSVDVRDSVFGSFGVALGNGNDTLTTSALQARLAVQLGDKGEDTLNVLSENTFAHEVIRGFEVPPDVNTNELARRPLARRAARLR
jgi:hypothetical protein